MSEIQENNSNVPKANIYEIYTAAYNAQTLVKITGCIQNDDKLTDITCYGRIKSVDGREALVVIAEQEVLSRPGKIYPNEFEYFFCLDKDYPQRMRLGYLGTGKILDVITDASGSITALQLRFSAKGVERRMRRDRRIDWQPEYAKTSGVFRLDAIPQDKTELKNLIEQHYRLFGETKQIVNISAAGACALLPDEAELKSLSAEHLLLYIISDGLDILSAAHIFLCKKIGVASSSVSNMLKLRMHFTHELDLNNSTLNLSWVEISNSGSKRLGRFIDEYCHSENGDFDIMQPGHN